MKKLVAAALQFDFDWLCGARRRRVQSLMAFAWFVCEVIEHRLGAEIDRQLRSDLELVRSASRSRRRGRCALERAWSSRRRSIPADFGLVRSLVGKWRVTSAALARAETEH